MSDVTLHRPLRPSTERRIARGRRAFLGSSRRPTDVDKEVGNRLRVQRMALGLSQTTLGNRIGVTFQQVQKYEKGANRIGPGRLSRAADVLGVTPAFFFGDGKKDKSAGVAHVNAFLAEGERAHRLARAFLALPRDLRAGFVDCIEAAAAACQQGKRGKR